MPTSCSRCRRDLVTRCVATATRASSSKTAVGERPANTRRYVKVGILALQGAFREHAEACAALGADVTLVKRPEHLAAVDAVVLPGGESTTQEKLLASSGLREPLTRALDEGMPCLATCAGVILLAH